VGAALSVGTFVTVVYPDHCVLTRVVAVDGSRIGAFNVASDGTPTDPLFFEDEGSTWIRGHHVPSSPEASAAVTALALRGQIEPVDDTALPNSFGMLANVVAGLGAPTKNILLGALTGALGAALLNSKTKAMKGPPPTRVYRKT
jgi:hypothetical protein